MEAANKLMLVKRRLQKMNARPKLSSSSFGTHLNNKYSLDAIEMADNLRAAMQNKSPFTGLRG